MIRSVKSSCLVGALQYSGREWQSVPQPCGALTAAVGIVVAVYITYALCILSFGKALHMKA